jgi:hypothetical protein
MANKSLTQSGKETGLTTRIISEDFDTRRNTAFPVADPIHGA